MGKSKYVRIKNYYDRIFFRAAQHLRHGPLSSIGVSRLSARRFGRGLTDFAVSIALIACGVCAGVAHGASAGGQAADSPEAVAAGELLAQRTSGHLRISMNRATGRARFVRLDPAGDLYPVRVFPESRVKVESFLESYRDLFGIEDIRADLELIDNRTDRYGFVTHTFEQRYRGVPVFGAMLRANSSASGDLRSVNGVIVPDITIDVQPSVLADVAAELAVEHVRRQLLPRKAAIEAVANTLCVYRTGLARGLAGANHLAYKIEVTNSADVREFVFVDAHTAKILDQITGIHRAISRRIYDGGYGPSYLTWSEGDPMPHGDADVDNVIEYSLDTYNLFGSLTDGGFLSWDGSDGVMEAVIDGFWMTCPDDIAFWNGQFINFCRGPTSDEVVAHEWVHGYSDSTHDLILEYRSGALNESYSDIFGEVTDLLNGAGFDLPGPARTDDECSSFSATVHADLVVNTPASIGGQYAAGGAEFNPPAIIVTANVVLVDDGVAPSSDACSPLQNPGDLASRIALIDRGLCSFGTKVVNAQNAGAAGVIVVNNDGDYVFEMSGSDPTIAIPSIIVRQVDGEAIKAELGDVNATLRIVEGIDPSLRWLLGEEFPSLGGPVIRDMWSPNCFNDPARVGDPYYYCREFDDGGLHTNSGIANHGFALLVDGGTFNGYSIDGIGLTKAVHIYWRSQTNYQVPTSEYSDHGNALAAACSDLAMAGADLFALDTDSPNGVASGETLSAADCAELNKVIQAVELHAEPTQCFFEPLLRADAPALCGPGEVALSYADMGFESGLGGWSAGTRAVANPATFDTSDWAVTGALPGFRVGAAAHIEPFRGGDCSGSDSEAGVLYLQSLPVIWPAESGALRLVFDHFVATEHEFDGANVKISVNGGTFNLLPAHAYTFNAYNVTLVASDNPLAGEAAFSGTNEGSLQGSWGQSQIDLASIAGPGDSLVLRFEIGLDACHSLGQNAGWYVDDVAVYECADDDDDEDGVTNSMDNCTQRANSDQRDSNGDGFGNVCDADLNGDCIVNSVDLGLFKSLFFSTNADADFNGDGVVNAVDLGLLRTLFFLPPGPNASGTCP